VCLTDMPALDVQLKDRITRYLNRRENGRSNAVSCYCPNLTNMKNSFVIYVAPSREEQIGIKYGEFVLLLGPGPKDNKTGKDKYSICFLSSFRKETTAQVLAETLFPPTFLSREGGISLLDVSRSKVEVQSASISLDHSFISDYLVSMLAAGAASRTSTTCGELYVEVETPFDVLTSSADGTVVKGVVLKIEEDLATVMFPKDKYTVSEGETKIVNQAEISHSSQSTLYRGSALVVDSFLLPATSFRNKVLPVRPHTGMLVFFILLSTKIIIRPRNSGFSCF
jgi:hypothetical protein